MADFSRLVETMSFNLDKHADAHGLTGPERAVFLARGGHAPGAPCDLHSEPENAHHYWCSWPDRDCICPAPSDRGDER